MAWAAVDRNKSEFVYQRKPERDIDDAAWVVDGGNFCKLPSGAIKKLIGRDLTWEDEPVELI